MRFAGRAFSAMRMLLILAGLCCRAAMAWGAGAPPVLRVGLFPNLSPVALVRLYAPLGNYLSGQLQVPVQLYTARNFRAFMQALHAGRYELAVAPPHLAWFAVTQCGYVPLARYTAKIRGVLVVRKGSELNSIAALRGKRIAFPDPVALMTQAIENALAKDGLMAGRDYRVVMAQSHNNAAMMVVRCEAAAAGIGGIPLRSLPSEVSSELQVIYTTPALSTQYLLVKASEPLALRNRIRMGLLEFANTPAGTAFLKRGGLGGIEPANAAGLAAYRKYLPATFGSAP